MRRRVAAVFLVVVMVLIGCSCGASGTSGTSLPPLKNAGFKLLDFVLDHGSDVFSIAQDSVTLVQNAIKLIQTIPANQPVPKNDKRGYIQVSIHYNKQGVDARDVYLLDSGKASLGIVLAGGKTFETFSANTVDIDATQTDKIVIVPLENATTNVTVSAGVGWQNTGLFVERGKTYKIKYVSGVWTSANGTVGTSDAAGQPVNPPPNLICRCGEPVPGYSTQALIGEIGSGELGFAPSQVGDDFAGVAYADDFLYLRMNLADQFLPNSNGSIVVSVETDNA